MAGETRKWQERLLPFMAGMLIALTVLFFAASMSQLIFLELRILRSATGDSEGRRDELAAMLTSSALEAEPALAVRFALESASLNNHYYQSAMMLMGSLFIRYLGFATGMTLALAGSVFILGRIRDTGTEISAESAPFKASLASASPGIVLAFLGAALMITTIAVRHTVTATNSGVYIGQGGLATTIRSERFDPSDDLPPFPVPGDAESSE